MYLKYYLKVHTYAYFQKKIIKNVQLFSFILIFLQLHIFRNLQIVFEEYIKKYTDLLYTFDVYIFKYLI